MRTLIYAIVIFSTGVLVLFLLNRPVDTLSPTSPATHLQCSLPGIRNEERPFTITVEGAMGVGKSTLLKMIEPLGYDIMTVHEPTKVLWSETNLGELFEQDPSRWVGTFAMQGIFAFLQAALQSPILSNGHPAKVLIRERSLYSVKASIVECARISGLISAVDYHVFDEWYNLTMQTYHDQIKPDLIRKLQQPF